ncbi:galectin-4-like isoform X1 [Synchiropus splendidus]|uniref:galectin-4-like isoform X1 n=1 Tax=Synchiropus splendidus TaxID=270530 RepID=UPI00237DCBE9|nr:galectin-4-like isoform X1 [Synchiropus splendidus]
MFVSPPGYQPVYRPAIPYLGSIHGGLREKMTIYIQGATPEDITRFFVNLLCGESESSDVALHINPRFDGWDKVVFNSRTDGSWQSEDKIRKMPFSKGEKFELTIHVEPDEFQIKVNGKHFHDFKHRVPVSSVRAMHISGDVSVETINVLGGGFPGGPAGGAGGGFPGGLGPGGFPAGPAGGAGGFYPGGMGPGVFPGGPAGGARPGYPGGLSPPGYPGGSGPGDTWGDYPGSNLPSMSGQPIHSPPVPFSTRIAGGMFPKRTLIIRGMVPHHANRLSFDLVMSHSRDIAFHLNPRFQEGAVVRNSRLHGSWGREERELSTNPFAPGQYFDMSIRSGDRRFKVYVNGQHLCDYFHRVHSLAEVDQLDINGDVQISYVHF